MNKAHNIIVSHIRNEAQKYDGELTKKLSEFDDEALTRAMFWNYRGRKDLRGFRLTHFGLQIMKLFFQGHEISIPKSEKLQALHLLYLEKVCSLPYYISLDFIMLYDSDLVLKLKLASGDIDTLIAMEENSF